MESRTRSAARPRGRGALRLGRPLAAALLAVSAAAGCTPLVGLDEFQVQSDLQGGQCSDPSGFGSLGCYSCTPSEDDELRNACTSAECSPFDNDARIPGFSSGVTRAPPTLAPEAADSRAAAAPASGSSSNTADAEPAVKCADLSPRPIYLYGSTALNLGMRTLAQAVANTATIVYQADASCLGLDSILTGISRLKGTAQYWSPSREEPQPCQIDGEQLADIGMCDVSASSCVPGFSGSANLVDSIGPAQVFMFTVPKGSTQKSISAEAAYAVFGYDDAGVQPWVDPASLVRRGTDSGTQLTIAASINLPPADWRGVIKQKSSEVKPSLLALANPEKGLGITSADVADDGDARANLRTLAYQHYGQSCAFTPDSSPGSSDKLNVRDGHYELWAPFHFYTRGQNGRTDDPFVAQIVSYLTGAKPLPNRNTDFITTLKQAGMVPACAMQVTRAREGARLEPFQPSPSCSCYFEASPPGGSVSESCQACEKSEDCPNTAPSCNFGYCEPA